MKSLFVIHGTVQHGKKRGKDLGFPTINISLKLSLPQGIYLSHAQIAGITYNALTFIGAAKTFNESTFQAETYILNFSQDIYGEEVTIKLLKKIRENQQFPSEQALIEQMEKDKKEAEDYFKNEKVSK